MWMNQLLIHFFILVHVWAISSSKKCVTRYRHAALVGYRCITANETYRNVTDVQSHICTHLCMTREECIITNYNVPGKFCLIGNDVCIALQKDTAYQMHFHSMRKRGSCVKWVSHSDFAQIRPVASNECHLFGAQRPCYVGRLKSSGNTLPGKYQRATNGPEGVWTILNGQRYTAGTIEVLDVQSDCHVTWVSFTTGDPIPHGAVIGGFLASRDFKLYVMRGKVQHGGNMFIVFGYYDTANKKGYMEYHGLRVVMEMDILISIWNTPWTFRYQTICTCICDCRVESRILNRYDQYQVYDYPDSSRSIDFVFHYHQHLWWVHKSAPWTNETRQNSP